jgi:hypothetical protein
MRAELGFAGEDPDKPEDYFDLRYRGARFSFGYGACPDLEDRAKIVDLLEPERIGVKLSEEFQLHPEQSTDASGAAPPRGDLLQRQVSDAAAVLPAGPLPAALLFDMDGLARRHRAHLVRGRDRDHGGLARRGARSTRPRSWAARWRSRCSTCSTTPAAPTWRRTSWRRHCSTGMVRHLRAGPVRWQPGAERLLAQAADAGVPCALVSSSLRPVVDAVLAAIGTEHFA